jgi:hypothetical protein
MTRQKRIRAGYAAAAALAATLRRWVWHPNRAGLYSSTTPDAAPFNKG